MVLAGLLLLLLVFEADACYTGHGPDQPWGLVCKGGPNSLQLSASVDARAADLVSFELAPNAAARDANVARDQSRHYCTRATSWMFFVFFARVQ